MSYKRTLPQSLLVGMCNFVDKLVPPMEGKMTVKDQVFHVFKDTGGTDRYAKEILQKAEMPIAKKSLEQVRPDLMGHKKEGLRKVCTEEILKYSLRDIDIEKVSALYMAISDQMHPNIVQQKEFNLFMRRVLESQLVYLIDEPKTVSWSKAIGKTLTGVGGAAMLYSASRNLFSWKKQPDPRGVVRAAWIGGAGLLALTWAATHKMEAAEKRDIIVQQLFIFSATLSGALINIDRLDRTTRPATSS